MEDLPPHCLGRVGLVCTATLCHGSGNSSEMGTYWQHSRPAPSASHRTWHSSAQRVCMFSLWASHLVGRLLPGPPAFCLDDKKTSQIGQKLESAPQYTCCFAISGKTPRDQTGTQRGQEDLATKQPICARLALKNWLCFSSRLRI